jgi:hypothetical protein
MSDLRDIIDSLYRQFLLRDSAGKIIPGLILIAAVCILGLGYFKATYHVHGLGNSFITGLVNLPIILWLLIMALGWLIGFAIQSIGEWCRLILYYPRRNWAYHFFADVPHTPWREFLQNPGNNPIEMRDRLRPVFFEGNDDFEWYAFSSKFTSFLDKDATPDEAARIERLVVIKEACGNGYISLTLSAILLTFGFWLLFDRNCLFAVGAALPLLAGAAALARMHFIHVRRQFHNSVATLNENLWTEYRRPPTT